MLEVSEGEFKTMVNMLRVLMEKVDNMQKQMRNCILKSRDITLLTKVRLVKAMISSSSHVWMWGLDYKESWVLKNWWLWTVVLEKTLESSLDCKRYNQSILKEISPAYSLEGLMLKLNLPPNLKNWLIGKDPDAGKDGRQEEKGKTEDEMFEWYHQLSGHEFE